MVPRWNSNFNLYTIMKKSVMKAICGMAAATSLILVCGEADSFIGQILWSGSMLAIFAISAKGIERCMTEEEKEERV